MKPKQLLLVAGPNGAGKSSLSKNLSRTGAVVFDPDKELKKLEERMPDLPEENLYHALNYAFEKAVKQAIAEGSDFTFESNLRDDGVLDTVTKFEQNDYLTTFVFIALGSIEDSQTRVNQRVKEGGHRVDGFSIAYNFEHSRKTLFAIVDKFEQVLVFESLHDGVNPILRVNGEEYGIGTVSTVWGKELQLELAKLLQEKGMVENL